MSRLYAVRGAVSLTEDSRREVVDKTQELLREVLSRNEIDVSQIVSILFTATDDIHAEFPAAAARMMGLNGVPLLCARELDVSSGMAMPRCIRVMLHYYADTAPSPVYLGDTARLLDPPEPA